MRGIEGRVALVTGAARGIGRAVAERLAADGALVAVNYKTRAAEAEEVVAVIRAAGGKAMPVGGDFGDPAVVASSVQAIEAELGPIALLVNNAGRYAMANALQESLDSFRAVIRDNLELTFTVTRAVAPGMVARGFGRIVNLSSSAGLRGPAGATSYAAAKAGVIALTKSWAQAWAKDGLRVNCIAPGAIDTEANAGIDDAYLEKLRRDTPLGRLGEPEEIASAASFLLSDESSFITGQTIMVCGGRVLLP